MDISTFDYSVLPGMVTMTVQNQIRFSITNSTQNEIALENHDQIDIDLFPGIDDPQSEKALSCFYLYLNFGGRGGDITTEKDADKIAVSLMDQPNWSVHRYEHPEHVYYWKVCPKDTVILNARDSLALLLESVWVNGAIGETPIHYKYRAKNILIEDEILLPKLRLPAITSFAIKEKDYESGDLVTFQWDLMYSENCTAEINNIDVTGLRERAMEVHSRSYNLIVRNLAGHTAQQELIPKFDYIQLFTAEGDLAKNTLTFVWKTKNCTGCEIDMACGLPTSGSKDLAVKCRPGEVFSYTLKAYPRDVGPVQLQTISFTCPQIVQFIGVDRYEFDAIGHRLGEAENVLPMNGEDPFISLREIETYANAAVVNEMYEAPSRHILGVQWDVRHVKRCDLVGKAANLSLPTGFYGTARGSYCLRAYSEIESVYLQQNLSF